MFRRFGIVLALLLVPIVAIQAATGDEAAWAALAAGGHVLLVRHAAAPGPPGDPAGFKLGDCATQRNLSEPGRAQARRLGEALRARGVRIDRVLTSRWCRTRETAELINAGASEESAALDNLQGRPQNRDRQMAAMRTEVRSWRGPGNLLMVSHGATIGPFTGVYPAEGEIIVVRPAPEAESGHVVVGRIRVDGAPR